MFEPLPGINNTTKQYEFTVCTMRKMFANWLITIYTHYKFYILYIRIMCTRINLLNGCNDTFLTLLL